VSASPLPPWLGAPFEDAWRTAHGHALLLHGPRGVGQFELALALATALGLAASFWPSVRAHFMNSTMTAPWALSLGASYRRSQVNDEIGYALSPGALVIDTRKSAGICFAAAAAAAVTVSVDAFTNFPFKF